MSGALLCLNAGSSSIKFALYDSTGGSGPRHLAGGKIEGIGTSPRMIARDDNGSHMIERSWPSQGVLTHEQLLEVLAGWINEHLEGQTLMAVGHRVVHGGRTFAEPRRVDALVMAELEALCDLAPLHQPHNLAAIRAMMKLLPGVPQVACFDTAFHHVMPPTATRLALPRALHDQGIRRYGFHGLSYDYIARRLRELDPALAQGRVIAAHLGNGASLCAMNDGCSVDTTMGFTALDGLMMGTRSGSIDPGVVLHLIEHKGMPPAEVEQMLYEHSGLLGVSGISSDMRTLETSCSPEAEDAMALFAWRAAREAGGLMASLGGLDGIVFTAGIGENDATMRKRICARLTWTGLELDEDANKANDLVISTGSSRVKALVIPTDEEKVIALQCLGVLGIEQENA